MEQKKTSEELYTSVDLHMYLKKQVYVRLLHLYQITFNEAYVKALSIDELAPLSFYHAMPAPNRSCTLIRH